MPQRHDHDDLITIGEAARILQVSTRTLLRWHDQGRLVPAVVLPSGHRRYRRRDIERIVRAA